MKIGEKSLAENLTEESEYRQPSLVSYILMCSILGIFILAVMLLIGNLFGV